jgi:hypothetical protein
LIVLYRMLFILYAEARGLLPLRESETYRHEYSLSAIAHAVASKRDALLPTSARLWAQLRDLFHIIDKGSEPLKVATFNGGLFDPQRHTFLEQYSIGDARLQHAIDMLTRVEAKDGKGKQFVDYRDLAERHLGTIYEGLLEHHYSECGCSRASTTAHNHDGGRSNYVNSAPSLRHTAIRGEWQSGKDGSVLLKSNVCLAATEERCVIIDLQRKTCGISRQLIVPHTLLHNVGVDLLQRALLRIRRQHVGQRFVQVVERPTLVIDNLRGAEVMSVAGQVLCFGDHAHVSATGGEILRILVVIGQDIAQLVKRHHTPAHTILQNNILADSRRSSWFWRSGWLWHWRRLWCSSGFRHWRRLWRWSIFSNSLLLGSGNRLLSRGRHIRGGWRSGGAARNLGVRVVHERCDYATGNANEQKPGDTDQGPLHGCALLFSGLLCHCRSLQIPIKLLAAYCTTKSQQMGHA